MDHSQEMTKGGTITYISKGRGGRVTKSTSKLFN